MAKNGQKEIIEILENIRDDIISSINALGLRATGLSSRTMLIRPIKDTGAQLEMEGYLNFVFDGIGRKPGRFPPIDDIRDWIQSKGINLGGMTIDQVTFLIGRQIAEKGTRIFRGRAGIPLEKIIEQNFTQNEDELGEGVALDVTDDINKEIIRINQQLAREAQ